MFLCLSSYYSGRQTQKPNDICMDHGHSDTFFFLGMGCLLVSVNPARYPARVPSNGQSGKGISPSHFLHLYLLMDE